MSGDSGRGPRGDRGPGGYGNPYRGDPTPGSSSRGGNLPVWALVLIMIASGLLTLTFVWLCVLIVCRKRRARRAAVRDLEAAQASQRETSLMLPGGPGGDLKDDAKRCEASEPGVELTFVVMAGEDQPSYLAKPAPKAADSPTAKDADAATAPLAPFEAASEKTVEKVPAAR